MIRRTVLIKHEAESESALVVDIAFQYADTQNFILLNYVNGISVEQGGVHVDGFVEGLLKSTYFEPQIVLWGLAAVVSIWYPTPRFEGSMKNRLINPEMRSEIARLVSEMLYGLNSAEPDVHAAIWAKYAENEALREERRFTES